MGSWMIQLNFSRCIPIDVVYLKSPVLFVKYGISQDIDFLAIVTQFNTGNLCRRSLDLVSPYDFTIGFLDLDVAVPENGPFSKRWVRSNLSNRKARARVDIGRRSLCRVLTANWTEQQCAFPLSDQEPFTKPFSAIGILSDRDVGSDHRGVIEHNREEE